MKPLLVILTLLLALFATGCNLMSDPKHPKLNPHPVQAYEITITIDGAPGPFDSVTGFMAYDIANKACVPEDPISGIRNVPESDPVITFKQISDNVYKGKLYLDLLVDEDYYGLGVCHWVMSTSAQLLTVHGVTFPPNISRKKITSNSSAINYYSKASYLDKNQSEGMDGGVPTNDLNIVTERPNDFFSIEISSRKVAP